MEFVRPTATYPLEGAMSVQPGVVYIVDDEPGIREALRNYLESCGLRVKSFESAFEYLSYKRTEECACLLLDLQLPDINGLQLQDRVSDKSSPPIIFMTGRGDIPSTVKAMKAGAVEFFTKPIDPSTLLAAIHAAHLKDKALRKQESHLALLRRRLATLSPRELEVLPLVIGGYLNKQAAATLGIKEVTLQIHRSQIMRKMAAGSLADLVRMARELGIEESRR
jgi:FixJ family two-component response regulator